MKRYALFPARKSFFFFDQAVGLSMWFPGYYFSAEFLKETLLPAVWNRFFFSAYNDFRPM